ncbi:MAG: HIT family protein [Candidatus Micrarchaeales archaeon]
MQDCIFCDTKEMKRQGLLYEDDICYVILEKFPAKAGESLVISKEHLNDIIAAPDDVVKHMILVAKKIAINHKKKLGATGVKFVINQGIKGVHLHILHFHIHVIPRYEEKQGGFVNEGSGAEISEKDEEQLVKKLKM